MPPKIRNLIRKMRDAGFEHFPKRGKGDHEMWRHPLAPQYQITLDGRPGSDAKRYQEDQVRAALAAVKAAKQAAGGD